MSSASSIGSVQEKVNSDLNCPDDSHTTSGRDLPIPGYVRQVLDRLDELRETRSGWIALCPCPTHGDDGEDRSPSLRISIGGDGQILLICRTGCATADVVAALGLKDSDLFCLKGQTPMRQLAFTAEELGEEAARARDVVYRAVLAELKLSIQHRGNLRSRGLTDAAIERNGYRTILRSEFGTVAKIAYEIYGDAVYEVPGFVKGKHGPTLHGDAGLVIPCRDLLGRIVALKVRRDRQKPKYVYFSTSDVSCGAQAHCPLRPEGKSGDLVRVVEGEIKSDIATLTTDVYTISAPGVSNWEVTLSVLQDLRVRRVLVAYDWPDIKSKIPVRTQLKAFIDELRKRGYEVGLEMWDGDYKGIDDALAAEQETRQVWDPAEVDQILVVERPAASTRAVLPGRIETVDLTQLRPQKVRWMWPGRVPFAGTTVLDGNPGDGKTLVALQLAAAVTTGRPVVAGEPPLGNPADVIFLSSEDGVQHTILPRLIAAGADLHRVHIPTVRDVHGPRPLTIPDDLLLLEQLIVEKQVALVVFDPFFAFLSEEFDSHKDAEVRRALGPVSQLAERTQAAIILIRHMNKRGSGPALYRGGGSIAISAAARSALIIGRDPDDPDLCVLAPTKSNLCRRAKGIAYKIKVKECPMVDHKGDETVGEVPYVEWVGERDLTADQVVAEPTTERKTRRATAAEWLRDFLADGSVESNRLDEAAVAAGITPRTLKRARKEVGAVSRQKNGCWWVTLPTQAQVPSPGSVTPPHGK